MAGAGRSFDVPLDVLASKPLTDGLLSYSGSGGRVFKSGSALESVRCTLDRIPPACFMAMEERDGQTCNG
eukprot:4686554-Amphidinium_carterae.1